VSGLFPCGCDKNGFFDEHTCAKTKSAGTAKHYDSDKPALQYVLGMDGLEEVARVRAFGAAKYGQWNYKGGMPWMKLLGSCTRHLAAYIRGEDKDPESGYSHLAHLVLDALMVLEYHKYHPKLDDRYKGGK
jgi:hypothetical protein